MSFSNFSKQPNGTTEEEEDEGEDDPEEEDEEQLITATFSSRPTANNLNTSVNNQLPVASSSQFSPLDEVLNIRPEMRSRFVANSNPTLTSLGSMDSGPILTSSGEQASCFFPANHHENIVSSVGNECGRRKSKCLLPPFGGCLCSTGSVQSSLSSASTGASTQPLMMANRRQSVVQHVCNISGHHLPSHLVCDFSSTPVGGGASLNAPSIFPTSVSATTSPPFSSGSNSSKQFCFNDPFSLTPNASVSFTTRNQTTTEDNNTGQQAGSILKLNLDQLNAVGTFANHSLIGESSLLGNNLADASNLKRNSSAINSLHHQINMLPTHSHMAAGSGSAHSRPLSLYEKRYLLAVERGDLAGVRRMIELAAQMQETEGSAQFNINCTDPLGRSALLMAIDNENLDMIELLIECGVEMRDSLLHAINEEFVEAVELLLDYEEALQRNRALSESAANERQQQGNANNESTDCRFDCRPTLLPLSGSRSPAIEPASDLDINNGSSNDIDSQCPTGNTSKPLLNRANNSYHLQSTQTALTNAATGNSSSTVQPHLYSWEGFERETFTSDVTPLILAAHKNNYEIIKLLLDRGISPLPCPHDARCGCRECTAALQSDCLRYSRSRINAYRALASPSLIGEPNFFFRLFFLLITFLIKHDQRSALAIRSTRLLNLVGS